MAERTPQAPHTTDQSNPSSDFSVEGLTARVLEALRDRSPDSWRDVYAWSDGRVTGPPDDDPEDHVVKLLGVFTPSDELPSANEVRQTIESGMAVVERAGREPEVPEDPQTTA